MSRRSRGCAVSRHSAVIPAEHASERKPPCSIVSAAAAPSPAPIWRETRTAAPVVTMEKREKITAMTVLAMPMAASALPLMVLMMRENTRPMKMVSVFSSITGSVKRSVGLWARAPRRRGAGIAHSSLRGGGRFCGFVPTEQVYHIARPAAQKIRRKNPPPGPGL